MDGTISDGLPNTLRLLSISFSAENRMNLNDLPTDVIRNIMRMVEIETTEGMRLISHRWNDMLPESLKKRQLNSTLPRLFSFNWTVFPQRNAELHIQLQQKDVAYFGVDWPFSRRRVQRPSRDVVRLFRCARKIEGRVSRLLSRCSRIKDLTLKMDIVNGNALKIVRDAMEHMQVENLTLSGLQRMDKESANMILEIVRNNKNTLKWLTLEEEGCSLIEENFYIVKQLLAEASTLIPRVAFVVRDTNLRYDHTDWNRIHGNLEMINSKMHYFDGYTSIIVRFESIN